MKNKIIKTKEVRESIHFRKPITTSTANNYCALQHAGNEHMGNLHWLYQLSRREEE
jgi:hypothetical protein